MSLETRAAAVASGSRPVYEIQPSPGPNERPASIKLLREGSLASWQALASGRAGLAPRPLRPASATKSEAENRPNGLLPVRLRHFCAASREPNLGGQVAAANSDAALLPLGLTVPAKRMRQGTRDMLIAREGEEIVCPKGTVCGRITRDANDQIADGDFAASEFSSSPADQRYLCACCGRPVAVREPLCWRVHLRRGWVR